MAGNRTQVDPRYLKYNKEEIEDIFGKMDSASLPEPEL